MPLQIRGKPGHVRRVEPVTRVFRRAMRPVLSSRHQPCFHRISLHIDDRSKQTVDRYHEALESGSVYAPLPGGPRGSPEGHRVHGLHAVHEFRELPISSRTQHHVPVIGHEDPGGHLHAGLALGPGKDGRETAVIGGAPEEAGTVNPPIQGVDELTPALQSGPARHPASLTEPMADFAGTRPFSGNRPEWRGGVQRPICRPVPPPHARVSLR